MTASLPRIGMSRSLASMPFWSGMTAVVLPTSGRPDRSAGALHVPQLDAEQDDVDFANRRRVVGRLRRLKMDVAARAEHLEPALAHRL